MNRIECVCVFCKAKKRKNPPKNLPEKLPSDIQSLRKIILSDCEKAAPFVKNLDHDDASYTEYLSLAEQCISRRIDYIYCSGDNFTHAGITYYYPKYIPVWWMSKKPRKARKAPPLHPSYRPPERTLKCRNCESEDIIIERISGGDFHVCEDCGLEDPDVCQDKDWTLEYLTDWALEYDRQILVDIRRKPSILPKTKPKNNKASVIIESWSKVRKPTIKQFLLIEFAGNMTDVYTLSKEKTKSLRNKLYLAWYFNKIKKNKIKMKNNKIFDIDGISFTKGNFEFAVDLLT